MTSNLRISCEVKGALSKGRMCMCRHMFCSSFTNKNLSLIRNQMHFQRSLDRLMICESKMAPEILNFYTNNCVLVEGILRNIVLYQPPYQQVSNHLYRYFTYHFIIPHMRILLSYWMRAMCQNGWLPLSL